MSGGKTTSQMNLQMGATGYYGVMLHNKKDLSEEELKQMCSKFGVIRSFHMTPNKLAFLEYKEFEEARAFLDELQNDIHFSGRVARRKFYDADCLDSNYSGHVRSKSVPPSARFKNKKIQFTDISDSDIDKPNAASSPVESVGGDTPRGRSRPTRTMAVVTPKDSFTRGEGPHESFENSFEEIKNEHIRKNSSTESAINDRAQQHQPRMEELRHGRPTSRRFVEDCPRGRASMFKQYNNARGYESLDDHQDYAPRSREHLAQFYRIPNHPPDVSMMKEPYKIERQDEYIYNMMSQVKLAPLYEVLASNLPLWYMMGDLFLLCSRICFISHIDMVYTRSPSTPPFALIHVRSRRDASILVNELNGHIVDNKRLVFEEYPSQPNMNNFNYMKKMNYSRPKPRYYNKRY